MKLKNIVGLFNKNNIYVIIFISPLIEISNFAFFFLLRKKLIANTHKHYFNYNLSPNSNTLLNLKYYYKNA